jgi:hypothetical protein
VNGRRSLWLVVLAALALRLVLLVARGDYIVYDEGYYLLLARSLRAGTGFTLNGLPHVALSPLQPVLVALISATGLPDLWVSRVLAAVCGALLVVPVAVLARLAGGARAALAAAVLTAVSPALMSFVPFFPGESWNLYFGSEPLFLLLAFGAVAMFAYSLGLGSLIIICGTFSGLLANLPKSDAWLGRIEKAFAILLILVAEGKLVLPTETFNEEAFWALDAGEFVDEGVQAAARRAVSEDREERDAGLLGR